MSSLDFTEAFTERTPRIVKAAKLHRTAVRSKHLHMARSHHNIRKPLCRLRGYKHIGGGTRSNSSLYGWHVLSAQ